MFCSLSLTTCVSLIYWRGSLSSWAGFVAHTSQVLSSSLSESLTTSFCLLREGLQPWMNDAAVA